MPYPALLTVADVESFYPTVKFSETTKPNTFQIEGWIEEATSAIYAAISNVYQIPVTDEDDLNVLKIAARAYVLPHVATVLRSNAFTQNAKGGKQTQTVDLERFDNLIMKMVDRTLNLPSSGKSVSAIAKSFNVTNEITPVSSKTEDLW